MPPWVTIVYYITFMCKLLVAADCVATHLGTICISVALVIYICFFGQLSLWSYRWSCLHHDPYMPYASCAGTFWRAPDDQPPFESPRHVDLFRLMESNRAVRHPMEHIEPVFAHVRPSSVAKTLSNSPYFQSLCIPKFPLLPLLKSSWLASPHAIWRYRYHIFVM